MASCNKPYSVKSDNPKMSGSVKPKSYMGGGMIKSYQKGGMVKGSMPDLTGDGKVTRADVLKGRGVFKDGGMVKSYQKGGMIEKPMPASSMSKGPSRRLGPAKIRAKQEMMMREVEDDKMTKKTQDAYRRFYGK